MNSEAILRGLDELLTTDDAYERVLSYTLGKLQADSGTLHFQGPDGLLHLEAHGPGMPPSVLEKITRIPIGKGMAGLAFERAEPVTACNLQTDTTGDVRPGAKPTGLRGSIVVPVLGEAGPLGTLGVGNQTERTFEPEEIELLLEIGRRIAARRQS